MLAHDKIELQEFQEQAEAAQHVWVSVGILEEAVILAR